MAAVVVFVVCQPSSAQQGAKLEGFAGRLAELEAAVARGPVPVIVHLGLGQTGRAFSFEAPLGAPAVSAQRAGIRNVRTRMLGRLGASWRSNLKAFDTLPLVAMTLDQATLRQLAADPEVLDIRRDAISWPTLRSSIPVTGVDRAWSAGYTGAGQTVAILDTGVDNDHAFFGGRVVSEACYSTTDAFGATSLCPGRAASSTAPESAENCNLPGCNHGTHVAGIAAGNGAAFDGVARDASIIAIQVFSRMNCRGRPCIGAYDSDVIRGLDRVLTLRNRFNIAAANLSLGRDLFFDHCDNQSPFKLAIDSLRAAGIATVTGSGNDGFNGAVGSPACVSTAVTVGSTTDRDKVSKFSNHATLVDLMAVGSSVNSSVPNNKFSTFNGTSMAAPHVAGAWALMKEAGGRSVAQIESCLENTGVGVTRSGVTVPRIQLDAAIRCVGGDRRVKAGMIVNVGSGHCLSGGGQDGAVSLAPCASGRDQRFDVADDGTLRLYGSLCLDGAPRGSILKRGAMTATECNGSAGQAWVVEPTSSSRLTNGKRCAVVNKNGQAAGARINVKTCKRGARSQKFALIPMGSAVEQCVGSAGAACAKAADLPKFPRGRRSRKGNQKIAVSVGTIAHDNCCRQSPSGYHCQGSDSGENETKCLAQWWQAQRDMKLGRFWRQTFGPYTADNYTDDLATVRGRALALPDRPGTGGEDSCDDSEVIASPRETAGTLALAAPKGTRLDCTDVAFCASGNARSPKGKNYIICTK